MQGDKRSFHSDKGELEALIQERILTEMGRWDRSRKQSKIVTCRCLPKWVVLTRMCTQFIINSQVGWVSVEVHQ